MDSIRSFIDAVQAFGERLAAVHWGFLVLAAALGVMNLALRSRGWQNILRAALPGELIQYRTTFGAYCAGVGVNAVIPARAGDLMKMYLVRRAVPNAGYATLTGSLVCETIVDVFIASGLLVWALTAGILPGVRLPEIPAFDLSLALRHPFWTLFIAGFIAGPLRDAGAAGAPVLARVRPRPGDPAHPGALPAIRRELPGGRLGLPHRRGRVLPGRLRRARLAHGGAHGDGGGEPRRACSPPPRAASAPSRRCWW